MGLDNAVCVKRNAYTNSIPELKRFEDEWDKEHKYDFEVVYFRKCWNIRNDLFSLSIGRDESDYIMSTLDIDVMIRLLESYNVENFTNGGSCIWDWDDEEYPYSEKIQRDIEALKLLRGLMDRYDLEVYFYDSY
jgi:hypothetical protein